MSIGLFKRPYTVRKYAPQSIANGYTSAAYHDAIMKLNVQPVSSDELQALPEGQRTVRRVKAFGADRLNSADQYSGTPGDRLFYQGLWFECQSSVWWDHTLLKHYRSEFVLCESQEAPPQEAMPP